MPEQDEPLTIHGAVLRIGLTVCWESQPHDSWESRPPRKHVLRYGQVVSCDAHSACVLEEDTGKMHFVSIKHDVVEHIERSDWEQLKERPDV